MSAHATTVDIDCVIATLPAHEQVLVKRLHTLISECIPQAIEKAYPDLRMPFYTKNRLICFIWPPSVLWEPSTSTEKQQAKGVALGFNQGSLMANEAGILLAEGRKQVHVMYFKSPDDINELQVRALLYEAALIDEQFAKRKKK